MTDPARVAKISRSAGIPMDLADIIEQYDGHRALLKELIKTICRDPHDDVLSKIEGRRDYLYLLHIPCSNFSFCEPIYCLDIFYDDMLVVDILIWMINGGIDQAYTGVPMADWLAERINDLMQNAYEKIINQVIGEYLD